MLKRLAIMWSVTKDLQNMKRFRVRGRGEVADDTAQPNKPASEASSEEL